MENAKKVLDTYMDTAMKEHKHLGLSFAFIDKDDVQFWNYGWIDAKQTRPVSEEDFFEVGSVGKVLSAILIARLINEGHCAPDDPIQKFVPEIHSNLKISLLDLLTHRSGLPREPENLKFVAPKNSYKDYDEEKLLQACRNITPPKAQGVFSYCSFGYLLLGLLAKRITTSAQCAPLIEKMIAMPLGLEDTKFLLSSSDLERFCPGTTPELESFSYLDIGDTYNPAGGAKMTTGDMAKLAKLMLAPESAPPELSLPLKTTQRTYGENDTGMVSFGWHVRTHNGHLSYYHPGSLAGSKSAIMFCPKLQRGVAYNSNTLSHVRPVWDILMSGT